MNGNAIAKIKEIMVKYDLTLAVAESITSGNLQAEIGSISGSSDFFKGGITAYNLGQKVKHLRIEEVHAKKFDCVSERVAAEMATGVCELFNSIIGIGTTGYAEPYPDYSVDRPYAYYAISDHRNVEFIVAAGKVVAAGERRVEMQKKVTAAVIQALEEYLTSLIPQL